MNLVIKEDFLAQTNQFAMNYLGKDKQALSYFHYSPFELVSFKQRANELAQRSFERKKLAQVIRDNHKHWGLISAEQELQLQRLCMDESMVVIGGQQAGVLLGPLYTIYKAITIIQAARQQEKVVNKPVIPIFWIAGEDHDYHEINHVYIPRSEGSLLNKHSLETEESGKIAISRRRLEKEKLLVWLDECRAQLPETEFTAELFEDVKTELAEAQTFVDFFARLMNKLFAKHGLLLINSDDKSFRRLQTKVFIQIIHQYDWIFALVEQTMERLKKQGYTPQVIIGEHPALLFIYENKERLLLEKKGTLFQTKNGQYTYTEEELIHIAEETPWKLSNNVITRPFMQESLFPTLAFVGGPGEIAYWALYKDYFAEQGLKLPIVLPRISITLVERPIATILDRREISFQDVFGNFTSYREQWLQEQDKLGLSETFGQVKQEISQIYAPLLEKIGVIESGLKELGEKNMLKIMEQIDYLEKRSSAAQKRQHEAALRQFDKVEQALRPSGAWQERVYNPYYFFNKHGSGLVDSLLEHTFNMNGKHKFIYL